MLGFRPRACALDRPHPRRSSASWLCSLPVLLPFSLLVPVISIASAVDPDQSEVDPWDADGGVLVSPDFDGDGLNGVVDDGDAVYFESVYLTDEPCADYDGSGFVDEADLAFLSLALGDQNQSSCVVAVAGVSDGPVTGFAPIRKPARAGVARLTVDGVPRSTSRVVVLR